MAGRASREGFRSRIHVLGERLPLLRAAPRISLHDQPPTTWEAARTALLSLLFAAAVAASAPARIQRGMPLADALRQLQQAGVNLIFTTRIVTPEMLVTTVPPGGDARAVLASILAPHRLALLNGPNGSLIVVRAPGEAVAPKEKPPEPPPITMSGQIVVESEAPASPPAMEAEPGLSSDEIAVLPHIGDEPFRGLALFPGTTTQDASAEVQLRGGRRDETLIRLDGQELYRPFHLRDFDNTLSIVNASSLDRIDLITAPSAGFGDRAAGVIDMTSRRPSNQPHLRISLSMIDSAIQAAKTTDSGRLGWTATLRRGTTDIIGRVLGTISPSFSDAFVKVEYLPTANQTVVLHELASHDEVRLSESDESKQLHTDYFGQYLWLSHAVTFTPRLTAESTVSFTHTTQGRTGNQADTERSFAVRDDRRLAATSLSHHWTLEAGPRQTLGAGVEYDLFHAYYDYADARHFETPLVSLRSDDGLEAFALKNHFDQQRLSAYAFDRFRPVLPLTIELGVRYDEYSVDRDSRTNPRFSAAWSQDLDMFHFEWGQYTQSHRPYELMVEDCDAHFYRSEQSRQWTAGYERILSPFSFLPLESVGADVYERTVSSPRPRYRNLWDGFEPFPEGQLDRVRIAPDESRFDGLELSLRGRGTPRIRWWLNYTLASARDEIAGRQVSRETDQRHALNADVNVAAFHKWNVNASWTFHSGWPTTPLSLHGNTPVIGALNSRRLKNYHRLDLRLSRDWTASGGVLTFYVEGRNLYDRRNPSGRDLKLTASRLIFANERALGALAIAGLTWRWR